MRLLITIAFTLALQSLSAQTLGGNAAFNFLKLPADPLVTAAGGVNVSYRTNEVGLSANNPGLLYEGMDKQLALSFNSFLAGIKTYSITGAAYKEKWGTRFGGHIYFVDYGSIPQTDAAGNESGSFHPVDFVVQASAARSYLERWNYGATLKFISSRYGVYRSSALAVDLGIVYTDTANFISAALLAKNMGFQVHTYAGEAEDLPFDLEIGITKKLAKAPFGFSITAGHLQHFNILYNDTVFNNANDFSSRNNFFNRLLNHFVLATHLYLGDHIEATAGFNYLRRMELNSGSTGNGLNGFSLGLRLKFSKLQVLYARTGYQRSISLNQLGLVLQMDRMFNPGKDL